MLEGATDYNIYQAPKEALPPAYINERPDTRYSDYYPRQEHHEPPDTLIRSLPSIQAKST
jgi:hypothetical protein